MNHFTSDMSFRYLVQKIHIRGRDFYRGLRLCIPTFFQYAAPAACEVVSASLYVAADTAMTVHGPPTVVAIFLAAARTKRSTQNLH